MLASKLFFLGSPQHPLLRYGWPVRQKRGLHRLALHLESLETTAVFHRDDTGTWDQAPKGSPRLCELPRPQVQGADLFQNSTYMPLTCGDIV
jgi:hypothetical protein